MGPSNSNTTGRATSSTMNPNMASTNSIGFARSGTGLGAAAVVMRSAPSGVSVESRASVMANS